MTVTPIDTLDPYRLPRHTTPTRYELTLEPDLTGGTFRGRMYDAWTDQPDSVDAELAASAAAVVATTGDDAYYDRMPEQYRNGVTPQVQLRHLFLLAEFAGDELMQRTLDLAMGDEMKTQNAPFVL